MFKRLNYMLLIKDEIKENRQILYKLQTTLRSTNINVLNKIIKETYQVVTIMQEVIKKTYQVVTVMQKVIKKAY